MDYFNGCMVIDIDDLFIRVPPWKEDLDQNLVQILLVRDKWITIFLNR